MNKILWFMIVFLYGSVMIIGTIDENRIYNQKQQLNQLQIQADEIAKSQVDQEKRINNLEVFESNTIGIGSYYDYTLPSGWSSKGHRVCASRNFIRGSTLVVTNLANGKSVECLVTDFGPDKTVFPERIVDLSSYAFSQIAPLNKGVVLVQINLKQ